MMDSIAYSAFPYPADDFVYPGADLHRAWERLHRGDGEPWPDTKTVQKLIDRHAGLEPALPVRKAAEILQSAWRAFHHGEFGRAVEIGLSLGPLGYVPAVKAANIHATYLIAEDARKAAAFEASARRAEEVQSLAPELPNGWYLHAHALGRYGQAISIGRALAEGLGGRVRESLDRALSLAPDHADAHIALGTWHAEVIGKVGGLIGGLTYGARREQAVRHFERALELNPGSAIARIEYGNGLLHLDGRSGRARALSLYGEAARLPPADAMERLDVELARRLAAA